MSFSMWILILGAGVSVTMAREAEMPKNEVGSAIFEFMDSLYQMNALEEYYLVLMDSGTVDTQTLLKIKEFIQTSSAFLKNRSYYCRMEDDTDFCNMVSLLSLLLGILTMDGEHDWF